MRKFFYLVFFILLVFAFSQKLYAYEYGTLWGHVVNTDHKPLHNVRILISKKERDFNKILVTDRAGLFQILGLPLGKFTAQFEAEGFQIHIRENIFLEPSQTLYLKVILSPVEKKTISSSQLLRQDYSNCLYQTILDESQIHESPSAHNVWSLVENQDLSATTNRIDVGGLWGNIPALFSARGGCSWTQNIYLLNGMDVTDPYWTGMPLFFPDFFALQYTQLVNAGLPLQALSPGAYFNLVTREGTDQYHGGTSAFFINKKLQSTNISPALEEEGIFENHSFNHLIDGNFHLSGPLIPEKLSFFTSLSGFHVSRDLAEYDEDDKSSVLSGLFSLKYRYSESALHFLWTGQIVSYPSFGAERNIPFYSTLDRRDFYNVFQAIWDTRIRDSHFIKVGFSFSRGEIHSDFQKNSDLQHGLEIFREIPSGTAPFSHRDTRNSLTLLVKAESLSANFLNVRHRFQYGFQLQHSFSSSQQEIKDNVHLHFFEQDPLEIIKYNTPIQHKEAALHFNFFVQDTVTFSNFVSIYFGLHLASSKGWIPDYPSSKEKNEINWLNLSPRFGLIFPISSSKKSAIKISAARYYFTLPLHYLSYGNPDALGGQVYAWNDLNNDRQYQEGEANLILRREGPFFSKIDSELKRPYIDELAVSYNCTFSSKWLFSLGIFLRETRNLVETINIGVPSSSYDLVEIFDIGDDRKPNTHDDLSFIVYDQKNETLGQDFFLLTNNVGEKRISKYYGADLTLVKKFSEKFFFFLTLTATSAIGTTNPGNTQWENDDGVIGELYDNPNTLINSRGRVSFDRAYTGRIGFNYLAPFDIRIGCIVKYYDGQPFARKIIVPGLNQGPFYIQAHPRGVSRYEYNRTVDIRVEKIINFGKKRIRIILDGFNILNRALATKENEWTGPEYPLRFATEIQSPRVFRLGLAYEF